MMSKKKSSNPLDKINDEIKKLQDNKARFSFIIFDTKGMPNEELEYIYEMALSLDEKGHQVRMLHTEPEFVGVKEWLGEKYANLPHFNATTDTVDFSPSDFLIITDACCNIIGYTKDLPAKRILCVYNLNYLFESFPISITLEDLRIHDVIVASDTIGGYVASLFPSARIHKIQPKINNQFYDDGEPKKLIVNILSNSGSEIETLVKSFYLRYPSYKWVSFRPVRNIARDEAAKALKEGAITVWMDNTTDVALPPVEAMAAGSIVLAKAPENNVEWGLTDGAFNYDFWWFTNTRECASLVASAIYHYLHMNISDELFKLMKNTAEKYRAPINDEQLTMLADKFISERKNEFEVALKTLKNNLAETENK